jgi:Tfp pilus assembly PilM family ATPase
MPRPAATSAEQEQPEIIEVQSLNTQLGAAAQAVAQALSQLLSSLSGASRQLSASIADRQPATTQAITIPRTDETPKVEEALDNEFDFARDVDETPSFSHEDAPVR